MGLAQSSCAAAPSTPRGARAARQYRRIVATAVRQHVELKVGGPDDPDGLRTGTVLSAYFHAEHMTAFRRSLWRRLGHRGCDLGGSCIDDIAALPPCNPHRLRHPWHIGVLGRRRRMECRQATQRIARQSSALSWLSSPGSSSRSITAPRPSAWSMSGAAPNGGRRLAKRLTNSKAIESSVHVRMAVNPVRPETAPVDLQLAHPGA